MKRKLLTIATCIALFGASAVAQESGFGAKLGLNMANISGDVEDNSMRISFNLGGYYTFMVSDKFGVQPELVYSGQGTKFASSTQEVFLGLDPVTFEPIYGTEETPEEVFAMNYINIPIMAKYYFTESFSVLAGPQIGILMSAKSKTDDEDVDVKEFFNTTDIALGIGLEYALESGLNFSARYNIGMTTIEKDLADGQDGNKNSVIQIGVGFMF